MKNGYSDFGFRNLTLRDEWVHSCIMRMVSETFTDIFGNTIDNATAVIII